MKLPPHFNRKRAAVRRALPAWYRKNARDLPWRRTRDPYRIWLAEIMLQQTRVETVVDYYRRFTKAFPNVRALARADQDRVLKLWEGLGYYARARNLRKAAGVIAKEHGGRLPDTAERLQELPGIGRYTAGAIASIAFGQRVAVLDGNVKRVLARLFAIEEGIDETATQRALWSLAGQLVPPKSPGDFNQALMELGSRLCRPKNPDCPVCPLRNACEAAAAERQDELGRRKSRKAVPHYDIVVAAICKNGRYLLVRRPDNGLLGGLWEFPGGRVADGRRHRPALVRKLRRRVNLDVDVGPVIATVDHAYSHFKITLHVYRCTHRRGTPTAGYHTAARWVPRAHFGRYAFPAAVLKILDRL